METARFAARLLMELVPLFLLVSTLVYWLTDALTPERIRRVLGAGSQFRAVPVAAILGGLTPFCSCTTVPLIQGMRKSGIATPTVVTFLLASPLVSPVAIILLWRALGGAYAALYATASLSLAAVGGLVVSRWAPPEAATERDEGTTCGTSCSSEGPSPPSSFIRSARRSLTDLRKLALPLGLAVSVGALIHDYVPTELLGRIAGGDVPLAVPFAAALGIPVYASVVVLLPLGSTMVAKGVSIGAVTAFLMGAAGFSLPEGILLSRILPRSLLLRILVTFATSVVAVGYLFQWAVG